MMNEVDFLGGEQLVDFWECAYLVLCLSARQSWCGALKRLKRPLYIRMPELTRCEPQRPQARAVAGTAWVSRVSFSTAHQ